MDRGRVFAHDTLEFRLLTTPSQVDNGYWFSGSLQCFYEEAVYNKIVEGIVMYSQIGNTAGVYDQTSTLDIAALGVSEPWTGSSLAAIDAQLFFYDVRLDVMPGAVWRLSFSDIEWKINGSSEWTYGSAGYIESATLSPNSVPLIAVPCKMTTGSHAPAIPTDPPALSISNAETMASGTVEGGWRVEDSGVWTAYPVTLEIVGLTVPTGCVCDTSDGTPATVSASDTYTCSLTGLERVYTTYGINRTLDCDCPPGCTQVGQPQYYEYKATSGYEVTHASVTLIPDLPKSIKRWQDKAGDYRAFWQRQQMPRTIRESSSTCRVGYSLVDSGTPYERNDDAETHPRQSEIISVVGEDPHAIEDTLGYQTLAPYGISYLHHFAQGLTYEFVPDSGRCIISIDCGGLTPCFTDSYFYCLLDSNEGITGSESSHALGILDAVSDDADWQSLATYNSTWANPHWSYSYWIEDWEVLGSTAFWVSYWGLIGSQWLYNAALPSIERRQTRNSIIESPLEGSPLRTYQGLYYGGRWLGISRFYADFVEVPLSVAMDSSSSAAWSAVNASLSHGSSVTVTPTNLAPIVDYEIGRFDAPPYQYPHIADLVNNNWSGSNIVSVTVELVSGDGSSAVTIGTTTGDLSLLSSTDIDYSGSWAQDLGAGWITDLGYDDGPDVASGESSAVMADTERSASFNYLRGFQSAILRFTFELSDLTPFTLDYPTFKRTKSDPYFSRESRKCTDILFEDGPGERFGSLQYVLAASRACAYLGTETSANDYECFKREWWLGVDKTGGSPDLDTELASVFDPEEGNLVADVDTETNALILPQTNRTSSKSSFTAAVVNSLREVPPLALAPTKERDTDYAETGDHVLESFSFAQEPRRYATPGPYPGKFEEPLGTGWTSVETGWPSGWQVSSHAHQVDNNDGYGYVTQDGVLLGRMRPWEGAFFVHSQSSPGTSPANAHDPWNPYYRAFVRNGDIFVSRADGPRPPSFDTFQVTSSGDNSDPGITVDDQRQVWLVWQRVTDVRYAVSYDDGQSFEDLGVLMATAYFPRVRAGDWGRMVAGAFYYNSGTSGPGKIHVRYKGPGDTAFGPAMATTFDVEPVGFDLTLAPNNAHSIILTAVASGGTDPSEWESTDEGATWTAL